MLRCCSGHTLSPSYASVCLLGNAPMEPELEKLEDRLRPSFTAWCSRCGEVSAICTDLHKFKKPSAYYAHLLCLSAKLNV